MSVANVWVWGYVSTLCECGCRCIGSGVVGGLKQMHVSQKLGKMEEHLKMGPRGSECGVACLCGCVGKVLLHVCSRSRARQRRASRWMPRGSEW